MFQFVILVFLFVVFIVLLRELIECFRPEFVFRVDKVFYGGIVSFLQAGKKVRTDKIIVNNRYCRRKGISDIAEVAFWDILEKSISHFSPSKAIAKKIEKAIEEAAEILDEAMENAKIKKSQEAVDYVFDCIRELKNIAEEITNIESIADLKKTEEQIVRIKDQAEQIAGAEFFSDSEEAESENMEDGDGDSTKSSWEILGLKEGMSDEEIKKAYRDMAQKYHPDKCSHLGDDLRVFAEKRFKEINEAYRQLRKQSEV